MKVERKPDGGMPETIETGKRIGSYKKYRGGQRRDASDDSAGKKERRLYK